MNVKTHTSNKVKFVGDGSLQAALHQSERFWEAQNRMMQAYSEFMTHWLARRQQAMQTALDTTRKIIAANGQPEKIPALCEEWVQGSWQRISADFKECQECVEKATDVVQTAVPADAAAERAPQS